MLVLFWVRMLLLFFGAWFEFSGFGSSTTPSRSPSFRVSGFGLRCEGRVWGYGLRAQGSEIMRVQPHHRALPHIILDREKTSPCVGLRAHGLLGSGVIERTVHATLCGLNPAIVRSVT